MRFQQLRIGGKGWRGGGGEGGKSKKFKVIFSFPRTRLLFLSQTRSVTLCINGAYTVRTTQYRYVFKISMNILIYVIVKYLFINITITLRLPSVRPKLNCCISFIANFAK